MQDIYVERPGRIRTRGPLDKLELNKYKSAATMIYPIDLGGENSGSPHFLLFNINIPEKTSYTTTKNQQGGGGLGVADSNRSRSSQISNGQDPFGRLNSAAVGIAAGLITNIGTIAAAVGAAGTPAALAATAVRVGISAAIVGPTLASIDLQRKTKRLVQAICLYVPDTVQQTTSNKYSAVSLTEAMGNAGLAAQGMQAGGADILNALGQGDMKLGSGRSSTSAPLGGVIGELQGKAAAASGAFGSGIEKVMIASAGYAQNPQIEILFDTVDNRTFQFDFKFTPRSQEEAIAALDIIKAFRFHAAPEISGSGAGTGGGRYFIPPSEFDIGYYFKGKPNDALHKFSTCVLEAIDVNYSNGNFATHDDGIPVEIGMTLRFKEVEIIHKKLVEEGY